MLKLLTGMCDDICPLNFRGPEEKDHVTKDPYYKCAPGWSSVSGGRRPYVTKPPAELAEKIIRAAQCVPLVRQVRMFVIDGATKRQVTIDELKSMDINVKPVPNLYKKAAAAAPEPSTAGGVEVAHLLERQRAVDDEISRMRHDLAATAAMMTEVQSLKALMQGLGSGRCVANAG